MIKKYALALLAFSCLNAQKPTCKNSPEPLTPEQIKYCENAKAFAALARKNPDSYDYFAKTSNRQVRACITNTPTSPNQIQHMEAIVALELMPVHQARHTWQASAKRVAGEGTVPLVKTVGTVIAITQTGKVVTLALNKQELELLLPGNLQATLRSLANAQNRIALNSQQLTLWQSLMQTIKNNLSMYDPRNFSTTQWVVVGIVVAVGAGSFVLLTHKDMHEPLPLVFFDTEEQVHSYLQAHGFSTTD